MASCSGTPYFCFKDIGENKPTGSVKIRDETISYFLKRYREDMAAGKGREKTIEEKLTEFGDRLRRKYLNTQPLHQAPEERLVLRKLRPGRAPPNPRQPRGARRPV